VLDTPVVLGQEAADHGQLVIYTGGDEKWVERARPALESFGRVMHLGGVGTGQIAKTINNLLLWSCMCANYEALTFAKKIGADIPKLIAALGEGSGANWSLSRWGKSTGKWAEKDMDVALEMAQDAKMPMPLSGLVDQMVKSINQEKMKALLS
jgi:3-hydroxyisobutyrate dehydrogenase-like beta-hydroxyacid dehydrogenase